MPWIGLKIIEDDNYTKNDMVTSKKAKMATDGFVIFVYKTSNFFQNLSYEPANTKIKRIGP